MIKRPLISVVVPCFNQGEFLLEALNSVRNQSYQEWECIIVNDGSTDETEIVAKSICLEDERFSYICTPNKGVSHARNIGIEKAKGVLLLPLDADDKIHQDYLQEAESVFNKDPRATLVYCRAEKFGEVNESWNMGDFNYQELLLANNMIFSSALFRKYDFENAGGYNVNMTKGWEDWDFWIRLLRNSSKNEVTRIERVLFYYRVKGVSRSVLFESDETVKQAMIHQAIKNNIDIYLEFFPDLLIRLKHEQYQNSLLNKGIVKNALRFHFVFKRLKNSFSFK